MIQGPIYTKRQRQRCDNYVMTLTTLLSFITRKHSCRIRTACLSDWGGGLCLQRVPVRNMGPGNQSGSDIIQRPPVDRQTPVKILPCPKLCLQAVTMESLLNGVVTHFRVTPLFSMRTVLLTSSQSCRSVVADAWCKQTLKDSVSHFSETIRNIK